MNDCHTGRVAKLFQDRGFGFLQPDDGGPDVFVHIGDCGDGCLPPMGAKVSYQIEERHGRLRAVGVELVR